MLSLLLGNLGRVETVQRPARRQLRLKSTSDLSLNIVNVAIVMYVTRGTEDYVVSITLHSFDFKNIFNK
jgi:hypothetical protein